MPIIARKRITHPHQLGAGFTIDDGLGLFDGKHYDIIECIIDLSGYPLSEIDESAAVTHGCSATFHRCWIRGAGKLILCGSGDESHAEQEWHKRLSFTDCLLEDGGRRFPEVQSRMSVYMDSCVIRNWGCPSRFDTRNFGAWAHDGGMIEAVNCVFWQDRFLRPVGQMLRDFGNHVGQAVNDEGWRALLKAKTYIPGVCRGLTSSDTGYVRAWRCWKNKWWIRIENSPQHFFGGFDGADYYIEMPEQEAYELVASLEAVFARLDKELPK